MYGSLCLLICILLTNTSLVVIYRPKRHQNHTVVLLGVFSPVFFVTFTSNLTSGKRNHCVQICFCHSYKFHRFCPFTNSLLCNLQSISTGSGKLPCRVILYLEGKAVGTGCWDFSSLYFHVFLYNYWTLCLHLKELVKFWTQ